MVPEVVNRVRNAIAKADSLIAEIENIRGSKLVLFFCGDSPITHVTCYRLLKIIRKLGALDKLDLLIDSSGGDIDAAAKIIKALRNHCKSFSVIIPCFCKSAATLIAISSDEQVMCKASELGVADPQVREPTTGSWIPAHSIKEAIDFIEETKDTLVKLSLADKLPPLLIGAYRDAENAAKQYIQEALEKLGDKKDEAIHTFTKRFVSHGYPIDRELCKQVGLNVVLPDEDLENKIWDLFEVYGDLTIDLTSNYDAEEVLIIQANSQRCVIIDGKDISSHLEGPPKSRSKRKTKKTRRIKT